MIVVATTFSFLFAVVFHSELPVEEVVLHSELLFVAFDLNLLVEILVVVVVVM